MFLELANTLRSLTRSPITAALNEAHRMARRRLEAGGAAMPAANQAGFVLPVDVDPNAVRMAIEAQLRADQGFRSGHSSVPAVLEVASDGRFIVPQQVMRWLGRGEVERGKALVDGIVKDVRDRRVLTMPSRHASPRG